MPSSILAGSGAIELVTVPVTVSPFTSNVKMLVRLLPSGPWNSDFHLPLMSAANAGTAVARLSARAPAKAAAPLISRRLVIIGRLL